jgi:carbonic anhydrase/acetyltransferase-like protein (isoleucine patch superfamily)
LAEQPEELPDNVVEMPTPEGGLAVARKAEGGLTLHFALDLPRFPSLKAIPTWTHQQLVNGALVAAVVLLAGFLLYDNFYRSKGPTATTESATGLLRANVKTDFNPTVDSPVIGPGTYVDKLASVIGDVTLGSHIFVAPFASIRGDEGQPIVVGDGSNIQDGVVLHALETFDKGKAIDKNLVTVDGKKYAVYIGKGVSLAHQSQVHGPAAVGDHTFVGMQSLVFKATVGKNVVIEPGSRVIGVNVPEGRYIPAGSTITTQDAADALPKITDAYAFAKLNDGVLEVNEAFADKYLEFSTGKAPAGTAAKVAGAEGHK